MSFIQFFFSPVIYVMLRTVLSRTRARNSSIRNKILAIYQNVNFIRHTNVAHSLYDSYGYAVSTAARWHWQ